MEKDRPFVADVPWGDLKIGDRVISAKGIPGHISKLRPQEIGDDDNMVDFVWDNGKTSTHCWHFWLNKVEYDES